MKIHLEIITAIRTAVGVDFPILLRLGASDYMEGGVTLEDSKIAVPAFVHAGVDLLDISGGLCRFSIPNADEPGCFAPLSQALKAVVSIPVMLTGGITTAEDAERLLREGKADLIGVGRAIYQDSQWAKHAMEWAAGR